MTYCRIIVSTLGLCIALVIGATETLAGERAKRAESVIVNLSRQATEILSQTDKPLNSRETQLAATIGRHFHFTLIAELVVGPKWEGIPQHERQEFLNLFRDFYLDSYGSQLGGYPDDEFTILSVQEKGSRDVFVKARLIRAQREAVVVDWRLREVLGRSLIIDILINGASVAFSHRENFHPVLSNDGIGGLITLFKIRAERLKAETRGFAAGELFEQGRFAEAVSIWKELAQNGDPEAQFNLSIMYAEGRGVEPDSSKAEYWNNRAYKSAYPPALHNKALTLLADGEEKAAVTLLEKSARTNFAPSQYTLGKLYSYALGVAENPARSFEFIRLAAESGMAEAQYNLGKNYRDGYGTEVDIAESFSWFERAAKQGYGKAQAKLVTRHGNGEGVPRDDIEALKWAILAAKEGISEAAEWQKIYQSRMTKADVLRAEQLAKEFKPQREGP
ncbi:ABC transporter substrate-binding protein [Sneathiella litorea]|uniref:ABC transporter substrate-binding protein n=1 Tax=Sneathiella litorea TaxID=2606216 RepID=UPI00136A9B46|nr:ABC transporter substrate-binding protein [Sneathiella litorea]